jgi:hypothetical protein
VAFSAQNIIDQACISLELIRAGGSMASWEYSICLDAANELLDSLSATGLLIPYLVRDSLLLTGPASYTIGSGATWNTVRPLKIKSAAVIVSGSERAVRVVSAEEYAALAVDRNRTGNFADYLCCDYAAPSATIYLNPAPLNGGNLELWSLKPLSNFQALNDQNLLGGLPAGYAELLKTKLAVILAPMFPGAKLTDQMIARAEKLHQNLAALNASVLGTPVSAEPAAPPPPAPAKPA